jgi:hypothetical protein
MFRLRAPRLISQVVVLEDRSLAKCLPARKRAVCRLESAGFRVALLVAHLQVWVDCLLAVGPIRG